MSLLPKFYASHAFPSQISKPVNVIDLYLDYACPFSAKLFKNWYENLYPVLSSKYDDNIQIIFRNYVQVWHPTSNLLHESGLAIAQLNPKIFLKFSYELFKQIEQFYDTETADLTRNEIYSKVYELVVKPNFSNDEVSKDAFLEKLIILKSDKPSNSGNAVTNDLKFFTRVGRQNGVHVTPTVLVNGFKDGSIESSTSIEEIEKKFSALL